MNSTRDFLQHATGAATLAVAAISLALSAGCASAPATAPPVKLDFPAPDSGPGRPDLSRADQEHINTGWKALLKGDAASARAIASQAGASSASELLKLQADLVGAAGDPVADLEKLAAAQPDYAAAWLTLSVAAENVEDEALALESATRGAALWSDKRWLQRTQRLHQRYVGDRIDTARDLYETENPEAALAALQPALDLDPENRDGVLVKARALIAMDQLDRAEVALSGLPRDPEVVRLSGNIAEARGDLSAAMRIYSSLPDDPDAMLLAIAIAENQDDWLAAMNLYTSLPDERPEKVPGLRRAKLRWRLSVMPEYVQEAVASLHLERAQLAVLVVTLAPKVETLPGGQVPLLSDVMTLPSQNEILTATRLGLIESDQFLDRFHPERPATIVEVRSAIDNLARLLDLEKPRWCVDEADPQPCAAIAEPVSGEAVAAIIIEVVAQEGETE